MNLTTRWWQLSEAGHKEYPAPHPGADAPGAGWVVRQHRVRRPMTSEFENPGFKSQGRAVYLPVPPSCHLCDGP